MRVFRARVVAGDVEHVSQFLGDAGHPRTLRPIAVSPAAEQNAKLPLRERTQGGQHIPQRVIGVRVVHQNRERLPAANRLQTPGRSLRIAKPAGDLMHRETEDFTGQRRGGQRVLDIVPADQLHAHLRLTVRRLEHEVSAIGRERGHHRPIVGSLVKPKPHDPGMAVFQHPLRCRVVRVHRRNRRRIERRKQFRLGGRVRMHRLVIIEVIAREIGESRPRKPHARRAALIQSMARHFDRARAAPVAPHLRQQSGDLRRRGRRHLRLATVLPVIDLHGADHPRLHRHFAENVPQEVRRCRFAVGSGHAQHSNGLVGPIVERVRQIRGDPIHVRHDNLRQRAGRRRSLHNRRSSAALPGVLQKLPAVNPRSVTGDKQIARPNLARILSHARDDHIGDHAKMQIE